MNYDVIIPATARNKSVLEKALPYIQKNLSPKQIVVISNKDLEICSDIAFKSIDENSLFEGLTFQRVREVIVKRDKYAGKRAGWYLQQFLKLSYAYVCDDDYYMSWDADTIPLRPIYMAENGHPYFDVKSEYNQPYFTTINKLFSRMVKKKADFSFISEHMIFAKKYVAEMLGKIDHNPKLGGENVFEKILDAVSSIDLLMSGFSEFETYGNYMMEYHPQIYRIRHLNALRDGDRIYGNSPTEDNLKEAAARYDMITFENRIET